MPYDKQGRKISVTGREAIMKWPEDERALSAALTAALPDLTFWEMLTPPGALPEFVQISDFGTCESDTAYALSLPKGWRPRWKEDAENATRSMTNMPDKCLTFTRGRRDPLAHPAARPPVTPKPAFVFQHASGLQGNFRPDDAETKRFVQQAMRIHRRPLQDMARIVDLRTGDTVATAEKCSFYMPGAASACRENPDLFLFARIDPADGVFWGYKPVD